MKRIDLSKYVMCEALSILYESCEERDTCKDCIFNEVIEKSDRHNCVLLKFSDRVEGHYAARLILTLDVAKTEKKETKNA
jgi:hypothetical protein